MEDDPPRLSEHKDDRQNRDGDVAPAGAGREYRIQAPLRREEEEGDADQAHRIEADEHAKRQRIEPGAHGTTHESDRDRDGDESEDDELRAGERKLEQEAAGTGSDGQAEPDHDRDACADGKTRGGGGGGDGSGGCGHW